MSNQPSNERLLPQALSWGSIHQERLSPADTMYALTGRRIYVIGDIDGRFRRRSNPYDMYAFGMPNPNDPLAYKLQGVWAQPVKGLAGYRYEISRDGERWVLEDADRFTQFFSSVQFDYQNGLLHAVRRDFASQDQPLFFSTLTLLNEGAEAVDLHVTFVAEFDLEDAWFTRMSKQRNKGEKVSVEGDRLVARADVLPRAWAAVVGGGRAPDEVHLLEGSAGELIYSLHLEPGGEQRLVFGMAVESQDGAPGALALLDRGLEQEASMLQEGQALYSQLLERGPHFSCPDPALNEAFDLARANLQALQVEMPGLGPHFYAGLEMFPFWFSNDGAYSVAGMMASGLREAALNHIEIGLHAMEDGRVPHQISPSGRVAFSGNAQETPLWVMSVWDTFRWTGDRAFLERMYPGALKGMLEYVLGAIDPDQDGYPSGPGMVEVHGMGDEKLDSAVYTWAALNALARMAETLGDADRARQVRARAAQIAEHFDADWWDPQGCTYAMSMVDPGNQRYPVPHWAVIVPLEVGLATADHAKQTFATLRARYLNQWGLKHTAGDDERVWTLPTATLSRAAYRYGERELGFAMLREVAQTLNFGSIGMFHELIPEGACFIQLWSGATFLRGIIEDLFGIEVHAAEHRLRIAPRLPEDWDAAELDGLIFGEHQVRVKITGESVTVEHRAGDHPLEITFVAQSGKVVETTLPPGKTAQLA